MDGARPVRYSQELATWAATVAAATIPEPAIASARTVALDALGCALSGTRTRAGRIAGDYARAEGGAAHSTLVGIGTLVSASHAAFANTMAGRIDLIDDADTVAHVHAGAATTMSALAVAEREDCDARDFLVAVVVGVDVAVRIGMAVRPAHFEAGFHPTGTLNCFGAAAAAGRLMHLDPARMLAALGLAAEQAAGLTEYRAHGPLAMSAFHGARAALSGILAADLARAGMPAPASPLEGERGFLRVLSPRCDPAPLLRDLGTRFAIADTEIKPFPGNRLAHGSIGAALDLRRDDPRFRADNVRSLVVRMARDAVRDCDRPRVASELEAQYSAQYLVALALARGAVTVSDFEDERWNDPPLRQLRERIRVEHAPELDARHPDVDASEIVAALHDGTVLRRRLDAPPGSRDNPVSPEDLHAKFEGLATRAVPAAQARELARCIASMDSTTHMRALRPLLAAPRP